jgi:hypothetical protein
MTCLDYLKLSISKSYSSYKFKIMGATGGGRVELPLYLLNVRLRYSNIIPDSGTHAGVKLRKGMGALKDSRSFLARLIILTLAVIIGRGGIDFDASC